MNTFEMPASGHLQGILAWLQTVATRTQVLDKGVVPESIGIFLEIDMGPNRPVQPVESFTYRYGVDKIEQLADGILERADQDARAIGGGRYQLRADGVFTRWSFTLEGPNTHPDRYAMQRRQEDSVNGGGEGFDPRMAEAHMNGSGGMRGDMRGAAAVMRDPRPMMGFSNPVSEFVSAMVQDKQIQLAHNERNLELLLTGAAEANRVLRQTVAEQAAHIRELEKGRIQTLTLVEELSSKKHERDLDLAKRKKDEERKDKAFEMLEPMAMAVMMKLFGGAPPPGMMGAGVAGAAGPGMTPPAAGPGAGMPQINGIPPVLAEMTTAFRDFTPEDLEKLAASGLLKPNQVQALLNLFKMLAELEEIQARTQKT